jgi:hypothetical protein
LWHMNLLNIKSPSFRKWENELNKGNTQWWQLCQRRNGQDCSLIGQKSYGLDKRLWMAKKGIGCIGEQTTDGQCDKKGNLYGTHQHIIKSF